MKEQIELQVTLKKLKTLLQREHSAIIHLRMRELADIQHQKIKLLKTIDQADKTSVDTCHQLIGNINLKNQRNGRLLNSGLRLIHVMQHNNAKRRPFTYARQGRCLNVDMKSTIISRRL